MGSTQGVDSSPQPCHAHHALQLESQESERRASQVQGLLCFRYILFFIMIKYTEHHIDHFKSFK